MFCVWSISGGPYQVVHIRGSTMNLYPGGRILPYNTQVVEPAWRVRMRVALSEMLRVPLEAVRFESVEVDAEKRDNDKARMAIVQVNLTLSLTLT